MCVVCVCLYVRARPIVYINKLMLQQHNGGCHGCKLAAAAATCMTTEIATAEQRTISHVQCASVGVNVDFYSVATATNCSKKALEATIFPQHCYFCFCFFVHLAFHFRCCTSTQHFRYKRRRQTVFAGPWPTSCPLPAVGAKSCKSTWLPSHENKPLTPTCAANCA